VDAAIKRARGDLRSLAEATEGSWSLNYMSTFLKFVHIEVEVTAAEVVDQRNFDSLMHALSTGAAQGDPGLLEVGGLSINLLTSAIAQAEAARHRSSQVRAL
jgi:hypothetical protein